MTDEAIIRLVREGLLLILLISGVPMVVSMIVGLLIGIFQATTQIQEQTLSYVPKLLVIFISLAILGPWMLAQLLRFTRMLFETIATIQ